MARTKEFDRERALHRAISAFSQKGFAATSTDDLMRAMEVGRQTCYPLKCLRGSSLLSTVRDADFSILMRCQ